MTTDPAPPSFDDVPSTSGPSVADQVASTVARSLVKWLGGIAASGIVVFVGAGLLFWSGVKADAAVAEQTHRTLQRDVAELAGDVEQHGHPDIAEDISDIRRDVARLETKVGDMAEDVARIERPLDERLPPRRRPR
jgi:ubiquinone biosynthesis protein UbiJ